MQTQTRRKNTTTAAVFLETQKYLQPSGLNKPIKEILHYKSQMQPRSVQRSPTLKPKPIWNLFVPRRNVADALMCKEPEHTWAHSAAGLPQRTANAQACSAVLPHIQPTASSCKTRLYCIKHSGYSIYKLKSCKWKIFLPYKKQICVLIKNMKMNLAENLGGRVEFFGEILAIRVNSNFLWSTHSL